MIHLRNEGPFQPQPRLQGHAEEVSTELRSLPGMVAATHWQLKDPIRIDGAEFHIEQGGEPGHIHLNGEIHIALTEGLRAELVAAHLACPFKYHDAWVTTSIASAADGRHAAWLFRLAYGHLHSLAESAWINRIQERRNSSH